MKGEFELQVKSNKYSQVKLRDALSGEEIELKVLISRVKKRELSLNDLLELLLNRLLECQSIFSARKELFESESSFQSFLDLLTKNCNNVRNNFFVKQDDLVQYTRKNVLYRFFASFTMDLSYEYNRMQHRTCFTLNNISRILDYMRDIARVCLERAKLGRTLEILEDYFRSLLTLMSLTSDKCSYNRSEAEVDCILEGVQQSRVTNELRS